MIKTVILHHLPDMNDLPAAERWFYRYHIPEVLRGAPSTTRYVSYRAVSPPPGAESLGYYNYKVHENWSLVEGRDGSRGFLSMTPEVVPLDVIMVNVPDRPTEDFMGKELTLDEKTILRWLIIFKYPEGVPVEEGEDWYLNVHAKEVMRQSGIIRFFSYRILPSNLNIPTSSNTPTSVRSFLHPKSRCTSNWHRVSEQWYENNNGWVKSIIDSPPKYTRPPWAKYDKYPFLEPFVDFASTFILERPTDDWLRNVPPFYI